MTTPLIDWHTATRTLRDEIYTAAYDQALTAIETARGDKATTETQTKKAHGIANGAVLRTLHKLPVFNGVTNPTHDDPIWGHTATPASTPTEDHTELAAWLATQTWSSFALSLARQYQRTGSWSPKQAKAAKSMKAKMDADAKEDEARQKPPVIDPSKTTGLDLTPLRDGYYAVPDGDTRLKLRIRRGKAGYKWDGWIFVNDGAAYGSRKTYGKQAPSGKYQGDVPDALEAILEDPYKAMTAYGRLTGTCGNCGRLLENEESIEAGIGPICRAKW